MPSHRPIRLKPEDARRYLLLRRRMLVEAPWAFAATPEDDVALDLARLPELLSHDDNVILAVEETPEPSQPGYEPQRPLAAAAGVRRMRSPKFDHRAAIWGVYVSPHCRGQGMGRAVVAAAVQLAETWPGVAYVDLSVSENSPEAAALYASLGFEVWGREPEATRHGERLYDELHLTRRLRRV